jgi:phospholipid/cholesterol/gamma-HCH transport system substrate-binding protein
MKNTIETRLGYFVSIIVIAAVFIMIIVGGFEKFQSKLRVHALFDSAQQLKPGDRVKLAGVEVGKVSTIMLDSNKVVVVMLLHSDAPVKADSVASIQMAGLMGQNFVSLEFGTVRAGPVANDALLNSAEQPDFTVIMKKLDGVASGMQGLTKTLSGEKIDNLLIPLTAAVNDIKTTSAQIASGKGTIGKLVFDEALYNTALTTVSNLQNTSDEVKAAVAEAKKTFMGVNAGEGTLGKLVKDEKLYAETTAAMTNIKEIAQKIKQGQGTIGKLINEQEFYKNAKITLQKVDKATEGLEDQGPLSVLGILSNQLF